MKYGVDIYNFFLDETINVLNTSYAIFSLVDGPSPNGTIYPSLLNES
jgi:hypothetical protein